MTLLRSWKNKTVLLTLRRLATLGVASSAVLLSSCAPMMVGMARAYDPPHSVKVPEVEAWLAHDLQTGASFEDIKKTFEAHGITSSYRPLSDTLYGLVRVGEFHGIRVKIALDNEARFVKAEVFDEYTGL